MTVQTKKRRGRPPKKPTVGNETPRQPASITVGPGGENQSRKTGFGLIDQKKIERVGDVDREGVEIIDANGSRKEAINEVSAPLIAAPILGFDPESFVLVGDNSNRKYPTEFHYSQYGVSIRFEKEKCDGVNAHRYKAIMHSSTSPNCVAAAYWLLDKLYQDSNGYFYTPGREGIKR